MTEIKKYICVSDNSGKEDLERKLGRIKISSFDLDSKHPLTKHGYKGFIRLKFLTPMFGGGPIPSFPNVNKQNNKDIVEIERKEKLLLLCQYILATFTPWKLNNEGKLQLLFEFNVNGLLNCLNSWNCSKCNEVNRQRFRYIQNLLLITNRNSKFEDIITQFRAKNAD